MNAKIISDNRVLPFPADAIFDVLASPAGHVEMDGSGTVRGVASGPSGPRRSPVQDEDEARGPVSDVVDGQGVRGESTHRLGPRRWSSVAVRTRRGRRRYRVTESFDWSTSPRPLHRDGRLSGAAQGQSAEDPRATRRGRCQASGLTGAKRQSRPGASAGRSAANASSVRRSTAEHGLPGPGGGDDSRRQWRGRRSDHDRR